MTERELLRIIWNGSSLKTGTTWTCTGGGAFLAAANLAETLPPGGILLGGTDRAEFGPDRSLRAVYNSLVGVDSDGELLGGYDKSHLVPFGEYMPLSGLLPLRVIRGGMDFSAGTGPVTLRLRRMTCECWTEVPPSALARTMLRTSSMLRISPMPCTTADCGPMFTVPAPTVRLPARTRWAHYKQRGCDIKAFDAELRVAL